MTLFPAVKWQHDLLIQMSVYETVYCLSTNFHNKQILQETIKRVFISLFVCLNMFQFTIHISKLLNKLINNFYEF